MPLLKAWSCLLTGVKAPFSYLEAWVSGTVSLYGFEQILSSCWVSFSPSVKPPKSSSCGVPWFVSTWEDGRGTHVWPHWKNMSDKQGLLSQRPSSSPPFLHVKPNTRVSGTAAVIDKVCRNFSMSPHSITAMIMSYIWLPRNPAHVPHSAVAIGYLLSMNDQRQKKHKEPELLRSGSD